MNKIFKVIWSKARGCYVVASEFAKSRTKSGRAAKAAAVAVAAALTLGMNGLALAADTGTLADIPKGTGAGIAIGETSTATHKAEDEDTTNKTAKHGADVAIGDDTKALGGEWIDTNNVLGGGEGVKYVGNSIAIGTEAVAQTYSSVSIGSGTKSIGVFSTALGTDTQAIGARSVVMGVSSFSIGDHSIAIGENAATADVEYEDDGSIKLDDEGNPVYTNKGDKAIAIGENSTASALGSIAIGDGTKSAGESATALGRNSRALGNRSVVMGVSSFAIGEDSIAIGQNAATANVTFDSKRGMIVVDDDGNPIYDTAGSHAIAIGEAAVAYGTSSIAMGDGAKAYAQYSTASGVQARASGNNSTAIGHYSIASKSNDTAVGSNAEALGSYSTALGKSAHAFANNSTALGVSARAVGGNSVAVGDASIAAGQGALASGSNAITGIVDRNDDGSIKYGDDGRVTVLQNATNAVAVGSYSAAETDESTAVGYMSTASGLQSTALGYSSEAIGQESIAIGDSAAKGESSISIGSGYTTASGKDSLAIGTNAVTGKIKYKKGDDGSLEIEFDTDGNIVLESAAANAVAIGDNSQAASDDSTALGSSAKALKSSSVAMGVNSSAEEIYSTAVGYTATASGEYSTVLGGDATASGNYSMAVGYDATASNASSVALGYQADAAGANNVALGASSTDKDENGDVYVGGYGFGDDTYTGKNEYVSIKSNDDETILEVEVSNFAGIGSQVYGTVSVGYTDTSGAIHTRTITNVAAGMISKDSTDAINGSQLYAVAEGLQTNINNVTNDVTNLKNKEQYHTVNGKYSSAPVAAPDDKGTYSGENEGNLLIAKTVDTVTGSTTYDISLNNKLDLGPSGSVTIGNTYIDNGSLTIKKGDTNYGDIVIKQGDVSFGHNIITNVETNMGDDYSVVNVKSLTEQINKINTDINNNITNIIDGLDIPNEQLHTVNGIDNKDNPGHGTAPTGDGKYNETGNLLINKIGDTYDISLNKKLTDLESITVNNMTVKNEITVGGNITINGDTIQIGGSDVVTKNYLEQYISNIKQGTDQNHTVNGADKDTSKGEKPDSPEMNSGKWTGADKGNLLIKGDKDTAGNTSYDISLNPDLDLNSVKFGDTYINEDEFKMGDTVINDGKITVGDTIIDKSSVTTNQVNIGDTVITDGSVKFDNNHYFTKEEIKMGDTVVTDNSVKVGDITINETNIDMGDHKITNLQAGTADTDAVNVSQLKELNQHVTNNSVQINKLKGRIDKVGAGAAALAALHPLDFDPDDKFYLSAGYGNYRGENAVAVGAFYQPNDDTLFSVSSTVGNDDDMINAGITWRFGQSSHQSRSKKAMAKEIIELRTEVAELKAMVYSLTGYGLDLEKSKLFPDTPENHWAYDYVAVVAGNGILEGYPDGYFDGDRPMTRYEMAAVVYRLLQKGVQVDNRMVQEFAPELARVRVDTLTHYNDGTPHIQRVRVIKGRG